MEDIKTLDSTFNILGSMSHSNNSINNADEANTILRESNPFDNTVALAVLNGKRSDEIQSFLDGETTVLKPFIDSLSTFEQVTKSAIDPEIKKGLEDGRYIRVDFNQKSTDFVLAQSENIEDGKELLSRYFNNNNGYKPLEGNKWNERIGQLLGYTDNDIAWSNATKYQNPVIKMLMEKTSDIRHKARKIVMLHDAQSGPKSL